jgi:hypothetical protein
MPQITGLFSWDIRSLLTLFRARAESSARGPQCVVYVYLLMYTHTHTHTHTHTRTCARTHAYIYVCMYVCVRAYVCMYVCVCTRALPIGPRMALGIRNVLLALRLSAMGDGRSLCSYGLFPSHLHTHTLTHSLTLNIHQFASLVLRPSVIGNAGNPCSSGLAPRTKKHTRTHTCVCVCVCVCT